MSPKKSISCSTVMSDELDSTMGFNTARYISHVDSTTSVTSPADPKVTGPSSSDLEVTVTVSTGELGELRGRCTQLEERIEALEAEKVAMENQLKEYIAHNQVRTGGLFGCTWHSFRNPYLGLHGWKLLFYLPQLRRNGRSRESKSARKSLLAWF